MKQKTLLLILALLVMLSACSPAHMCVLGTPVELTGKTFGTWSQVRWVQGNKVVTGYAPTAQIEACQSAMPTLAPTPVPTPSPENPSVVLPAYLWKMP